jgi:hypothetical protein
MSEKCKIACARLSFTLEDKKQYETLKERIFKNLVKTEEITDGYSFVLNQESNILYDLAGWLTLEHKCCPFLHFTLVLFQDSFIRLNVTGPKEIKGFLLQELNLLR